MSTFGDGRRDPDALLSRAGIRGNRHRDQHFLIDDRILNRLPQYAASFDRSNVLEIGAGTGGLTDRLLTVADHVTAIERDERLVRFLRSEFAQAVEHGKLTIANKDATTDQLPEFTTCISNLPYGASSPILFRLLPKRRPMVVMLQLEFAERLVASPGTPEYGRLSVTAGHYAEADIVETVPPTAFSPAPPVESAIVTLTPTPPAYHVEDEDRFMDFVRAVFTQRRKTMRNAIRNTTHISGITDPTMILDRADPALLDARPGDLEPAEFAQLIALEGAER